MGTPFSKSLPILSIPFPMQEVNYFQSEYDLFVIGGGLGGVALAKKAASLGSKVGIAWPFTKFTKGSIYYFGGCSKLIQLILELSSSTEIKGENQSNLSKWLSLQEKIRMSVNSINCGCLQEFKDLGIDCFNSLISFQSAHTLQVKHFENELDMSI